MTTIKKKEEKINRYAITNKPFITKLGKVIFQNKSVRFLYKSVRRMDVVKIRESHGHFIFRENCIFPLSVFSSLLRYLNAVCEYSILPITRTSKGPMKMVRVNECSSYPG